MVNRLQNFRLLAPALFLAVVTFSPADGAIFDVTKTTDTLDGACNADCSLREAVQAANDNPGHDKIVIPAGTYVLTRVGTESDSNTNEFDDLDVRDDTTIEGAGMDKTIVSGNDSFRVFHVINNGPEETSTVRHLTVRNAYRESCGGGIRESDGTIFISHVKFLNNYAERGAGMCARGIAYISDSIFEGNTAELWGGGLTVLPRRVSHSEVVRSTFVRNEARDPEFGGDGGGIEHCGVCTDGTEGSTLDIINSTFDGNIAKFGGAIWNTLEIYVLNSTINDNASTFGDGAVANPPPGIITFENSILDNSPGLNCRAPTNGIFSAGHNIETSIHCELEAAGDQSRTDPQLGELADNGGPTPTIALMEDSPAIDAGGNRNCPDTDQRGELRPVDGEGDDSAICDIGAYEAGVPSRNPGIDALPIILDYLLGDDAEEG